MTCPILAANATEARARREPHNRVSHSLAVPEMVQPTRAAVVLPTGFRCSANLLDALKSAAQGPPTETSRGYSVGDDSAEPPE